MASTSATPHAAAATATGSRSRAGSAAGLQQTGSAAAALPTLTLPCPTDDLHVHLRDGEVLEDVLRATLTRPHAPFEPAIVGRALLMPNLQPPLTTAAAAAEYGQRVRVALQTIETKRQAQFKQQCVASGASEPLPVLVPLEFQPLLSLYLTDQTTPQDIEDAKASGVVVAYKLYPKGATTHSNAGVTNLITLLPTFRAMAEANLLLLVHGESTVQGIDPFEREAAFLPSLGLLLDAVPSLRVVLEHASTRAGIKFVSDRAKRGARIAATLTAHHLLMNRDALFAGGMNPAHFCRPLLQHEEERQGLLNALLGTGGAGGDIDDALPGAAPPGCLFAGTDSAPHPRSAKEKAQCCAAGCYTAPASVELYAEVFEAAAAERGVPPAYWHRRLQRFLCQDGAKFYGLPPNVGPPLTLQRKPWTMPAELPFGSTTIIPLRGGESVAWRLKPRS